MLRNHARNKAEVVIKMVLGSHMQALLVMLLSRWSSRAYQQTREDKMRERQVQLMQFDCNLQAGRKQAKRWAFRIVERLGDARAPFLQCVAFIAWRQACKEATYTRKAAGEWARRCHRQESEGYLVARQVTCKARLKSMVKDVVIAHQQRGMPLLVDAWRRYARTLCLARRVALCRAELLIGDDVVLCCALQSWRSHIVRTHLRAAGQQVGLSIAKWGDVSVASKVCYAWRDAARSRTIQRLVDRMVKLFSVAPLFGRNSQLALRHWRNRAVGEKQAAFERAVQARVPMELARLIDAQQLCWCHRVITVWRSWSRYKSWALKDISWLAHWALQAWKFWKMDLRLARWHSYSQRMGQPKAIKATIERSAEERVRRAKAQKRFARWYSAVEEEGAALPKCFAAWVLAVLQESTSHHIECFVLGLGGVRAHYREAAAVVVGRFVAHFYLHVCVLRCFKVWWDCCREGYWLQGQRQWRMKQNDVNMRLCRRLVSKMMLDIVARCFLAWYFHLLVLQGRAIQEFHIQAEGVSEHLRRLNRQTYGFLNLSSAIHVWRCACWKRGKSRLVRFAKRQAEQFQSLRTFRLVWECLVRWARATDWQGFLIPLHDSSLRAQAHRRQLL